MVQDEVATNVNANRSGFMLELVTCID